MNQASNAFFKWRSFEISRDSNKDTIIVVLFLNKQKLSFVLIQIYGHSSMFSRGFEYLPFPYYS